jgi:hypothetical protein
MSSVWASSGHTVLRAAQMVRPRRQRSLLETDYGPSLVAFEACYQLNFAVQAELTSYLGRDRSSPILGHRISPIVAYRPSMLAMSGVSWTCVPSKRAGSSGMEPKSVCRGHSQASPRRYHRLRRSRSLGCLRNLPGDHPARLARFKMSRGHEQKSTYRHQILLLPLGLGLNSTVTG